MTGISRAKQLVSVLAVIVILVFGFAGTSYALIYTNLVDDAPGMDEYRWDNEDFYWIHSFTLGPPAGSINWAKLTIKAKDVDYDEYDHIYTYDTVTSTVGTSIEYLDGYDISPSGYDNQWNKTVFTLPSSLYADIMDDDFGVFIDIGETYYSGGPRWAVEVDWSELKVDYNPVPEPTTMLLLGTGLIGLAVSRKRLTR